MMPRELVGNLVVTTVPSREHVKEKIKQLICKANHRLTSVNTRIRTYAHRLKKMDARKKFSVVCSIFGRSF